MEHQQHQQQQQQQQQQHHRYTYHRGGGGGGRGGGGGVRGAEGVFESSGSSSRGGRGGGGGSGRGGDRGRGSHYHRGESPGGGHHQRITTRQPHTRGGAGSAVGSGRYQQHQHTGRPSTIQQTTPERRSGAVSSTPSAEVQTETRVWPERFIKELCRVLAERNLLSELCHLSQACREWNTIASDDNLWRAIYQKQWRDPVPLNMNERDHRWKELFAAKVRFSVSHLLTYFGLDEEPTDYGEEDQPASYGDYLDLMGDSNGLCSSFEELDLYEVHLKDVSYASSKKHKHYPPTLEVNEKEYIVIAQNRSVDYILLLDISKFEGLATPQNPKVVLWEMLAGGEGHHRAVDSEAKTNASKEHAAVTAKSGEEDDQRRQQKRDSDTCNEYVISETFLHFLYQNCFHKWEMNYNQDAYPYSEELFSTLYLEYVDESSLMRIASNLGFESLFFSDSHNFCGVSKDEDALIFYSKGRMIFDICTETKDLLSHYRDAIKSQLRRSSSSPSSSAQHAQHHHSNYYHNSHPHHNQHHTAYVHAGSEQRHNQQHQYHQSHSYHRYNTQQQHAGPYYQSQPYQQYYPPEQQYYPYYLPPQPGFYLPPYQSGAAYPTPPFNYPDVYQPHQQQHRQYGYPLSQFAGEDGGEEYYAEEDGETPTADPVAQFSTMRLGDQQQATSTLTHSKEQ